MGQEAPEIAMSSSRTRTRHWVFVTVLLTGILVLARSLCTLPTQHITEESVRAELTRSIPLGSDPATVERYLDARGIENSGFIESAGLLPDRNYIMAMWHDVSRSWLVTESIQARFDFEDRELVRITVRPVYTGL